MNRRERRKLERKGVLVKDPVVTLKVSDVKNKALTDRVREAMETEINRQILEHDEQYWLDIDSMVMWTLYRVFGFGPKRLRKFYEAMIQEHLRMREYYQMNDCYPEREILKRMGVDIEAWGKELRGS